jgi:hypothetical protein
MIQILNIISKYLCAQDVLILLKVIISYVCGLSLIELNDPLNNHVIELLELLLDIYNDI